MGDITEDDKRTISERTNKGHVDGTTSERMKKTYWVSLNGNRFFKIETFGAEIEEIEARMW